MENKRPLTSEEISNIIARITDEFGLSKWEEIEMMAKIPPEKRWLVSYRTSEAIRADLRNKLLEDFPELTLPEINMRVLRSLTPVQMGKNYTEPAYYEHFG